MDDAEDRKLTSPDGLAHNLLRWYDSVHTNRDMPWRTTKDPYAIWLSETMLQQTQVATVKAYYRRFLDHFPTPQHLAAAPLDDVLALWAGLGYYRRARHLHAAAKQMVDRHAGQVPNTLPELLALPGVGRYTAGAVASIAFGLPAPIVDGNVMRVVARLTCFPGDIADPKNAPFFWSRAEEIVAAATPHGARYGDVNQALMELGATVCVPPPAKPACLVCPVRDFCRAYAEGRQLDLPVKRKKAPVPEVRGTALVVLRQTSARTEVLVMKRPAGVVWEHLWEFPVFSAIARDTPGRALKMRAQKSPPPPTPSQVSRWLGLRITRLHACGEVVHTLTHRRMVYQVFSAFLDGADHELLLPACREGGAYTEARWVRWPLAQEVAHGRVVGKIADAIDAANLPPSPPASGR